MNELEKLELGIGDDAEPVPFEVGLIKDKFIAIRLNGELVAMDLSAALKLIEVLNECVKKVQT